MLHKRQRVTTTDEASPTARTTTTRRATTTASTVPTAIAGLVTDLVGVPSSSSSFQPGVAASGTATRSVANTPPTRTRSTASTSYPYSFASESSLAPVPTVATPSATSAAQTGLTQGAVTGIAVGAGVLGVVLLAGIGWCCWKKRKSKDADELGWTNLGNGPTSGQGGVSKAVAPTGLDGWASNDTLASGPYGGGEKLWAQQSLASLSSFDEKGYARSPQQQHHALPIFAPQNIRDARAELLGPPTRSTTQQSFPRSATNASIASAPTDRIRPTTGAQSVNDVITFSAAAPVHAVSYPPSPAPAHLPSRGTPTPPPPSHAQSSFPPSTPPQAPRPSQPQHQSLNGVPVGPQPITAAHYPPRRPLRPSEVPSIAPGASPYQFARRPEQAQRDTQELERDERLEGRFVEVMTGQVGREESDERPRERNKKDTIVGLTDAYGGEDEELDDEDEERDQVDPAFPPAQLLRRTSSRKRPPPVPSTPSYALPSEPSAAPTRSSPPTNPRRYSTRVDSKPLRELEAMFEQLPPSSQRHYVRASEASDLSGLAAAAGVRLDSSCAASYRTSDASSYAPAPAQATAPLAFTRHPLAPVPEFDSQESLSPADDVFGSAPAISIDPPTRKSSARALPKASSARSSAPAPAPLRLARTDSLAHARDQVTTPPAAARSHDERHPFTLSTAERDVLYELGLPSTPELSSSPLSSVGPSPPSSSLGTPASDVTPVFHLSRPSLPGGAESFIDVSPSPSPSREPFAPHKASLVVADPLAASGGWESLSAMASGKSGAAHDAGYRSATMSLYGMYE
ncbi:hypothetical protein JCM3770_007113 [Rhodotorula araucariae]